MSKTNSNTSSAEAPARGFGLSDATLRSEAGPAQVDQAFLSALATSNPALAEDLANARHEPPTEPLALAELLIEIGAELDAFLAELFHIQPELETLRQRHEAASPLLRVKYKFVKRQALLSIDAADRKLPDPAETRRELKALGADPDNEPGFAQQILDWQAQAKKIKKNDPAKAEAIAETLLLARRYAAWAAGTAAGRRRHASGVLFDHPQPVDPLDRIEHRRVIPLKSIPVHAIHEDATHARDGFDLTDPGFDLNGAMDQAKYCLLCHRQGNDSCSHGLRTDSKEDGSSRIARDASGELLSGCPLDERISEFHALKLNGHAIGALAMIALDNPMLAATGHRICNDCMKSCVYQQQTPVDIPQAETRVLRDVLELPWGFEIYALLTRWNPLNLKQWVPAAKTGKRVLVVGAGPAGFTLAHHLLNSGHTVVAIDGLKVEPGADTNQPVRDAAELSQPLSERVASGFGGVAEYGITVRWDKNFLTLIRLLLERRERFRLIGGVRFGGTLTTRQAWAAGFDHIALATGAGRPNILNIPGGLAPGVRAASDFLMALQLTGAARKDSIANLQMRLPTVVIGGGLTAMDTATEALAYYPVQVEKFLHRFEVLCEAHGEAHARAQWADNDIPIADEFLAHAHAIRAERHRAHQCGESPDIGKLLQQWGGVTVAYRRALTDSPAYRLNPEELGNALAEGVRFAEHLSPKQIQVDDAGHAAAVELHGPQAPGKTVTLPARTVLIAAGTHPNAVLAREEPELYELHGDTFAALDEAGTRLPVGSDSPSIFCRHEPDGRKVSFIGDAHPSFAGNVVKAMASAKYAAPVINAALDRLNNAAGNVDADWLATITDRLSARVHSVKRLAPGIVEVAVRAPAAARAFQPGQFYRLQNFESGARCIHVPGDDQATRLSMEGLAMTGAWVDVEQGLLGTIVLEMGGSSDLCADLVPEQPVVLMGPTGSPTEIPSGQTVVLVGGGLGNAVLFSIGTAMRAAGCQVLYFAGYRNGQDRFSPAQIEAAADHIVWCVDSAPALTANRPGDTSFVGNIVDAMHAHERGEFANIPIRLGDADRLITIGSDKMMAAVAHARHARLANAFSKQLVAIASVNSPMQCMMKEICAQCLQKQIDPVTGTERIVFSCVQQDQPLDAVDFDCLADRLAQNRLAESQTRGWLSLVRERADPH
jgi:NADPH-dependent glutamate synthase beta subunit-like oxidoreductase/NAD(P)H-flavin reductase